MEIWKDIPGWEKFYQVSNLGRVRSIDRKIFTKNPWGQKTFRNFKGRILSAGKAPGGYPLVVLTRTKNLRLSVYVHDLVLLAFKGPKPKNLECCHGDGNRANAQLENLRYDTRSANVLDRHKHGTMKTLRGIDNPNSKLTARNLKWILRNKKYFTQRELGKRFSVSHSTIGHFLRKESYR